VWTAVSLRTSNFADPTTGPNAIGDDHLRVERDASSFDDAQQKTTSRPGFQHHSLPRHHVRPHHGPGSASDSWEGLQGVASFFPYRSGGEWYAVYGSAQNQELPSKAWQVGLAKAPDLGGPWSRCSNLNPLSIEPVFIEKPIVHRLPDGTYLAVYDTHEPESIGYA
jgi:hypothetical protein